jgi:dipeptidyl aminopeptidase/acylaminoacyl peptidase
MRLICALCVLFALSANAQAATPRVITHEDLWLMPRVGAPQISPDGVWAVFRLLEPSYRKDEEVSDLWLVPADGREAPRRITSGKGSEIEPAWSADSRLLAFVAKRGDDKEPQVYVIDLARGGEAQRATRISTGVQQPQFSPDGTRVLYVSKVPAGSRNDADSERLAKETKERKYKAHSYTTYPVRAWDKWIDERHAHLFVQRIGDQDARDLLAGTRLAQMAGFKLDEKSLRWTTDGSGIVFAASRNQDRAAWSFTHADLWLVPAAGGEPRRLTGTEQLDPADSFSAPRFSRDGRILFALVAPRTDRVYNANRVAVFDWPSMRERARIALPDAHQIEEFDIDPDARNVYLLGEVAGQVKLFRASVQGGSAQSVGTPDRGMLSGLSIGGMRVPIVLAAYESANEPPEIVRVDLDGRRPRSLSSAARSRAAALDLAPVEHFWFTNARGQRIHNMLVRPPAFDARRKYPLLVLMHGGPHSQWRDAWVLRWNYHLLAAPGHVVLLTNYVGSTSGAESFAQAIQGDPFKGPADDVNAAADEAIRRYPFIDGGRQCAAGASYGGHLANWMQATTTRYRCLVSHAGLVNLETQWGTSDVSFDREATLGGPFWEQGGIWREQNPIQHAPNFRTPVLVTFGEKDFRVPVGNGLEYWTALQRQQVESKLIVFPEENHWILGAENSRYFYREVEDWLTRWLESGKESAEVAPQRTVEPRGKP